MCLRVCFICLWSLSMVSRYCSSCWGLAGLGVSSLCLKACTCCSLSYSRCTCCSRPGSGFCGERSWLLRRPASFGSGFRSTLLRAGSPLLSADGWKELPRGLGSLGRASSMRKEVWGGLAVAGFRWESSSLELELEALGGFMRASSGLAGGLMPGTEEKGLLAADFCDWGLCELGGKAGWGSWLSGWRCDWRSCLESSEGSTKEGGSMRMPGCSRGSAPMPSSLPRGLETSASAGGCWSRGGLGSAWGEWLARERRRLRGLGNWCEASAGEAAWPWREKSGC